MPDSVDFWIAWHRSSDNQTGDQFVGCFLRSKYLTDANTHYRVFKIIYTHTSSLIGS